MKKVLILSISLFMASSAFAVCSITGGACSAPVNFESSSLKDRLVPNNLKNLQKTDYFQQKITNPYGINSNTRQELPKTNLEAGNYNDECQFGECLPSGNDNQQ